MILVVSRSTSGPLAVAIAELLKWYRSPDPQVRRDLVELQRACTKDATGGQTPPSFDPAEIASQAVGLRPRLVDFEEAGRLMACSERTVSRRVRDRDLACVGTGPAARIVLASIDDFIARSSSAAPQTPQTSGATR